MRQIIILGHNGMLGQMAVKFFSSKNYNVITLANRYGPNSREAFIDEIKMYPEGIVINAIGKIKQKTDDIYELLWANAILPLDLTKNLLPSQTLILPSTDCVFSGTKGKPYLIDEMQDATDEYGWSKQLGEQAVWHRKNTHIFRVSIIGLDNSPTPKGLLGWFLSQSAGSQLKGFTNHLWNGITTLEWCKYAETLFEQSAQVLPTIHQLGTKEHYSKYDMLCLFNEIFGTTYQIEPFEPIIAIDRRLEPTYISKNLKEQLLEMKQFDAFKF